MFCDGNNNSFDLVIKTLEFCVKIRNYVIFYLNQPIAHSLETETYSNQIHKNDLKFN